MGAGQSKEVAAAAVDQEKREIAQHMPKLSVSGRGPERLEESYICIDEDPPAYSSSKRNITLSISETKRWEKKLLADPKNRLALSALSAHSPTTIIANHAAEIADSQVFNIKIPLEGAPITNQRSSGRCWLFASTNVFRVALMKLYNLKSFELSQAYPFFWDKMEKANWFLEHVIDTADEELDGRLVQRLMSSPMSDGGQWDMVTNLVGKYGLVPQGLYPDTYNAKSSSFLGKLVTTKLREDALVLRKMATSDDPSVRASISDAKNKFLQEIHSILTILLGPPPSPREKFTWEYYDANGKFHKLSMTPLEFASSLSSREGLRACKGTDVNELFSLVNDPRNPYERLLTVDRLGNVVGGQPVTYVNVDMDTMKAGAVSMLKAGIPVFFGSDVGKYSNSASGIMDTALHDYSLGFNVNLGMSKADRLQTGESSMTHAMVLTAVHIGDDGKPVRWRVENSWGDAKGDKGWFVMTDKWMDEFVYQVVVDPRFVSQGVRDVLKQAPLKLPLWDPMGALA
ncbi:bleomycin hydrolase [[Emmonsia] crescens]|uniref:Cysteine proteinase 1, mitochondrial n=1 Tax=[Emmonsia] crescens TaxID=73230 RepID=A0A0G2HUT9_9EURO|nr:bleomycin hydrolase [Emmonsia crescens UAMH 3008]